MEKHSKYIRFLETLSAKDVPIVGGKNASLGEMLRALKNQGILVPDGFATTADAYWDFIHENQLDVKIEKEIQDLKENRQSLENVGKAIREFILSGSFSKSLSDAIREAYLLLSKRQRSKNVDVAIRSSATAEDLPEASFAGEQESFLNIRGTEEVLKACLRCFASLFTDRAIAYREAKKFDHLKIALSVGIQKMVRSDKAGSGVAFTLDTETGFRQVVVINAGWGLGENIVQGTINPDEYTVFKPLISQKKHVPIIEKYLGQKDKKMVYSKKGPPTKNLNTSAKERSSFVLSDEEILQLADWSVKIENHYQMPMDIEWAKDGISKEIYIVQARPETVQSQKKASIFHKYTLKQPGRKLVEGLAIGEAIIVGKVKVIKTIAEMGKFEDGCILVTQMTSPDWVPLMQKSIGIITDHGGRTSHAAIVSRELSIPAIVGTENATKTLHDDELITLSCAEGSKGYVYEGKVDFTQEEIPLDNIPEIHTQILMNIASPAAAFRFWQLPCRGIGLARMEFIINNIIQIHPMALVHFEKIKDKKTRRTIEKLTKGYREKTEYFIDQLAQGIGKIAASRYPDPVIVRMSDFKTNEYANLIGGMPFEPKEENPMLGFRGASRYYSPRYREGFGLECQAIKQVREIMGLTNVIVMIPFCRTLEEADKVLKVLAEEGLKRHENGLEIYVMAEIPSNIILAEEFADRFDGFSIGSNDLTQLILGVDRDSEELAPLFDERNAAVMKSIEQLIHIANQKKCKIGICGQAPSDHPDFAEFLVRAGIDSISLNPDTVIDVIYRIAKIEKEQPFKETIWHHPKAL